MHFFRNFLPRITSSLALFHLVSATSERRESSCFTAVVPETAVNEVLDHRAAFRGWT